MASIKCGNCKATHHSVAEVKACYNSTQPNVSNPQGKSVGGWQSENATEPQRKYVASLWNTREVGSLTPEQADKARWCVKSYVPAPNVTKANANDIIKTLKAAPEREARQGFPVLAPQKAEVAQAMRHAAPEGFYERDGKVYKVVTTQNGVRRYAKLYSETTGKFDTVASGMVYELSTEHALTAETAMAVGKGTVERFNRVSVPCLICGRTLTDDDSMDRGIGPICMHNMGW